MPNKTHIYFSFLYNFRYAFQGWYDSKAFYSSISLYTFRNKWVFLNFIIQSSNTPITDCGEGKRQTATSSGLSCFLNGCACKGPQTLSCNNNHICCKGGCEIYSLVPRESYDPLKILLLLKKRQWIKDIVYIDLHQSEAWSFNI